MPLAAPDITDRLVMMTATTKTFNIAGAHIGNVIIADPDAAQDLSPTRMNAMGISPNSFGMHMATAAYSPEGAAWVDDLMRYLDGNRRLFDDGHRRAFPACARPRWRRPIWPGSISPAPAWPRPSSSTRVEKAAKIATNHGASFRQGRRKLPALQPRLPARPGGRGG